jgi:hypothetical protein
MKIKNNKAGALRKYTTIRLGHAQNKKSAIKKTKLRAVFLADEFWVYQSFQVPFALLDAATAGFLISVT